MTTPGGGAPVRESMAVSVQNTKNLRSKFEQLEKVTTTGNATRNRRGYTVGNDETKPMSISVNPPNPPRPVLTKTPSGANLIPVKENQQPTLTRRPTNPPPVNPSIKLTSPSVLPQKTTTGPVKQPTIIQNSPKQTTPPKKVATPPVEKLEELELEDSANRTRPKHKPKPDLSRQTVLFTKPPVPVEPPKEEKKEIPKTPTPPPESRPTTQNGTPSEYFLNDIGDKWKIKYDELEFDELVSAGSAGEVYLGYYFGTPVAIKKLFALPSDQKHLVAREFSMLQGVNHPNIVQFLGICDHESGVYLITEYVEHGDLFDLLVFGGEPLSWKSKVKISLQVAQAVYYLHSRNIIHRDLKSQNVLIGDNQKVKLCDLGLATIMDLAKRMTVCGTHEWMAPEIMLQDKYDSKVDVFSFGIVLTELITNQPPKKREMHAMMKFDDKSFLNSLPEGCPPDFANLVVDCCRFKPDDRPAFKDIVARLRKLQNELPDD